MAHRDSPWPPHGPLWCGLRHLEFARGGFDRRRGAKAAGVSQRTVRRRLSDPEFAAKVEAVRSEVLRRAVAKVSAGAVSAADTLLALLRPSEGSMVRLGAARAVLDFGIRLRAEVELSDRLRVVEQHLGILEKEGS